MLLLRAATSEVIVPFSEGEFKHYFLRCV